MKRDLLYRIIVLIVIVTLFSFLYIISNYNPLFLLLFAPTLFGVDKVYKWMQKNNSMK
jgi:hypothetical protein